VLPITRHDFHGDWNYTLKPQPDTPYTPHIISPRALRCGARHTAACRLTGVTGSVDVSAFGKPHDYARQRPPMHARRGRCPRVREVPLVRETVDRRTCEPVEAPITRVPPRPR